MSADNKKVVSNENLAAFAEALAAKVPLKSDIPTKVSDLQNDLGFTDNPGTITSVTLNGTTTSSGGVDLGYLVVQEGGKGLSSNDYTALEKTKLGGIDTGAQVNTIETVKVNGTALVPDANKAVNVQVPTTVAELSDASDYAKTSDLEDYVLITDLEDTEEVLAAAVNDLNNRLDGLVDQYPTENSTNAVSSGGVYEAITENELVTAASLSDLNARVSDLESIGTPEETDPVFSASPAAGITAANITSWNSKVDASEYEEDSEVVASALNDLNTRISDVSNGVASITDSIPDILIIDWYFRPGSYYSGDQYVWEDIEAALQEGKYVIIKNSFEYNDNISPLYYHFVEAFEDSEGGRFWCFATPCCYKGRYYKVVLNSGDGFESFESCSLQGVTFNNVWSSIHDGTVSISESDPVFSASAAAGITASDITNWNSKTSNTGTLTGVSFNGTAATVTNGVASITASIPDVANYFDEVAYDSQTKRINFKHGNTVKKYIDATDFIKDGMVDSVEIATPESGTNAGVSCLIVSFNTDAGKEDIEIPLSSIFNPSNYYTKTEADGEFVAQESGKGLSSEDYTSAEKTKLSGIETGAQVNVKPDWNAASGSSSEILNKPSIPVDSNLVHKTGQETVGGLKQFSNGINVGGQLHLYGGQNSVVLQADDVSGFSWIQDVDGESIQSILDDKQDVLTFDSVPTENSTNPVSSGGVYTTIAQSEYVISTSLNDLNTRVSGIEGNLTNLGYLSLDGGDMNQDAGLNFIDSDNSTIKIERCYIDIYSAIEDQRVVIDANTPGVLIAPGTNDLSNFTLYRKDGVTNRVNNTFYQLGFPNKDGTLALTSDIPSAVTESTVSGWGFTKNTGTYSKPSGGIPASDLTTAVQTSLGKADTALQSFTETDPVFSASAAAGITSSDITNWNSKTSNTGTITGINMNGASKGTSGVVDLGTVITSHAAHKLTASNGTATAVNQGTEITYVESLTGTNTATSGDLSVSATRKKVTIPTAVTESTVSGWGFTKNAGTLTGVKVNGSNATITSGVADIGTVITSETQLSKGTTSGSGNAVTDISVSNHQITLTKGSTFLTSHQNIKTINNQTITGTGNLTLDTLPTVSASDNGKILMVVNGAWALVSPVSIYSGSGEPNNSMGNNGDIYLQT